MKTVDVMIPVYRPGKDLRELLRRLSCQSVPPRRICIVNTEEQYWDPALEQEFPEIQVTHISRQEFDHGGTRRNMAAESTAEYLLFLTQDALPADRFLIASLLHSLEEERVKAAYGRQLPRKDCGPAESFARQFNYPETGAVKTAEDLPKLGIKTFFCSNVCAMYDRSVYEELGGFVEHTIFNEDMIYAQKLIRAGYAIAYQPEARVIHSHNYSCLEQLKRNFDLGVSQTQYREVFEGIRSEGEGMRMVKKTILFLLRERKPWLIPGVILQSGCKYTGYLLGKNYRRLPDCLIRRLSMNREYWRK